MKSNAPGPLQAPKIFRFVDIDEFRSSVRNLSVDFTPLVRTIAAEQIILNLPGCDLNFTKSFPRIIDAQVAANCTIVGFSMDDGVPIRFNGIERDEMLFVIGGGGALYSSVETTPRQYASIIFTPEIENRGWPRTGASFRIFETSRSAHARLRRIVTETLVAASTMGDAVEVSGVPVAMRESLLAAIDTAVAEIVPARWADHANRSGQFKVFRDVEEALSGHVGDVIYSEELAARIGVSVRTMNDAVHRYRGMSLHRYLRLRRLWLVRRRLIARTDSVKAAALAYGFWHLGDFSHSYREQFGEAPSETLAKSLRH
jgi:AraC family ethanolamine operon transcriptional activator